MAADDGLALPDVRSRGAHEDSRRQRRPRRDYRQPYRRDQGRDSRARRQDPHGEDVSRARHVFRRHRDQPRVSEAHRAALPWTRLLRAHRQPAQPRHLVHQVRPRIGPDDRPDEPLQHDVRPVLHGREPGRLRPRAVARRGQADPRRLDHDQAAAADVGAVLRRRADDLADLSGRGRLRAAGRLLQRAGRHQRHRVRAGPDFARRPRRPACASPTCSSTASARKPTRTARSATSSR